MSFSIKSLVNDRERTPSPFAWSPFKEELPPLPTVPRSIIELAHSEPTRGISSALEQAHWDHVERTKQETPVSIAVHLTVADFEHLKETGRWDEIIDLLTVSATVKIVL
jgi:hypothetical protein